MLVPLRAQTDQSRIFSGNIFGSYAFQIKLKCSYGGSVTNALPTKENLKRRKILDDATCSACLSA